MIYVKAKPYRTNLPGTMQLRTMRRVKAETSFGWATLTSFMNEVDDEMDVGDLMCEPQFLAWLWAWVLNAGDDVAWDDMQALTLDDIAFSSDDAPAGESDDAPDPTSALPDSVQGADEAKPRPAKAASKPATKPSKKPSTRGSR